MWAMRGWTLRIRGDRYILGHKGTEIEMKRHAASLTVAEWSRVWTRFYLPSFSLEGRTVLDAGAGSGETAYFYFLHGAKKVVAVEKDPEAVDMLKRNATLNSWNVDIIDRELDLPLLREQEFDFMKLDIEGAESILLQLEPPLKPLVVEAHGEEIKNALMSRFNLTCVKRVWSDRYLLKTRPGPAEAQPATRRHW